ncbi:MAG TPA: DUF2249 domain-containing protein [Longimicrobiales bacterium]|nr:DUF2249 domain-containing protein [Longimicrobiales bacterium]
MIRRTDRVSTVLREDESLVEVFVGLSPAFRRLRKPGMRKVMSRLVTVEQAARMAGVDPDELVRRLNERDTGSPGTGEGQGGAEQDEAEQGEAKPTNLPAELLNLPPEKVVDLDVRQDLREGREPFSRIMSARREVPDDGVLRLRAIFEPVPLYAVMEKQGLTHQTEQLGEEDWRVWFYNPSIAGGALDGNPQDAAGDGEAADDDGAPGTEGSDAPSTASHEPDMAGDPGDPGVVVLDVRGLEPPEPMVRTLAALETLPADGTLVQLNVRIPRFLLPVLEERGFAYEFQEQSPGLVRVFIRRADEGPSRSESSRE